MSERASRIPRLPISREPKPASRWTPGANIWPALEAACDVSLNGEQRANVAAIIDRYYKDAPIVANAPLSNLAVDRLRKIEKAALDFRNATLESAKDGMIEAYSRSVMNEYLRESTSFANMVRMLSLTTYGALLAT